MEQLQSQSTQTTGIILPDELRDFILEGPMGTDYTTPSSWAVVKLPRFFLLKGHDGKYLKSVPNSDNDRSVMFIGEDKMDGTVYEAVPLSDEAIGIRCTFYGRFLAFVSRSSAPFQALHTSLPAAEDEWRSQFWPVKLGRGTDSHLVGLRLFRSRLAQLRCLNLRGTLGASNMDAARRTGFEVEEAVSQRQIYGVTYDMEKARISEHEPLTSVTKDVKNWSETPQKGVLRFSHTERESHSWGSTDTVKMSASVEMSVRIPFVGGPNITTEAYFSGAYEWGEEQETAKQIGTELQVEVPGKSMVQATMIVQKGKLEVPFSYGQRDTLYNGYTSLSNLPDGIFTSVNTYVTYETVKRCLA